MRTQTRPDCGGFTAICRGGPRPGLNTLLLSAAATTCVPVGAGVRVSENVGVMVWVRVMVGEAEKVPVRLGVGVTLKLGDGVTVWL